jgi:hypothetical protein
MTKRLAISLNLLKVSTTLASLCLLLHAVIISDFVKDSIGDVRAEAKTQARFKKIYDMTSIAENKMSKIQLELFWVSGLLIFATIMPWFRHDETQHNETQ